MGLFSNYEVTDSVKKECTAQQLEMIDALQKLGDDFDSIGMESIKAALPSKFTTAFYGVDGEDTKNIELIMKFLKIYKEFIDLTKSSAVVIAEQCAQINKMEHKLAEMNSKLDKIIEDNYEIKKKIK